MYYCTLPTCCLTNPINFCWLLCRVAKNNPKHEEEKNSKHGPRWGLIGLSLVASDSMKACLKEQINQIVCTCELHASSQKLASIAKEKKGHLVLNMQHFLRVCSFNIEDQFVISSLPLSFFVVYYHPNHHWSAMTDGMLAGGKVANCYSLTWLLQV